MVTRIGLAREVLERVEIGVVIASESGETHFMNEAAVALGARDPLPAALQTALGPVEREVVVDGRTVLVRQFAAAHELLLLILRTHQWQEQWRRQRLASGFALTDRELDTLEFVCAGESNAGIAAALGITLSTTKKHVTRLREKLAAPRRPALPAIVERFLRGRA